MKNLIYAGLIATIVSSFSPSVPAPNNGTVPASFINFNNGTVPDTSSVKIETKQINIKNNLIESQLKFPKITGLSNLELQKTINVSIENDVINFKNRIFKLAMNSNMLPFQAFTDYKILYNENHILSFYIDYYEYTGGAHGLTTRKCYNIDLKTGTMLSLGDLFKSSENENYKNIINEEIMKEINKNPSMYFVDQFKGIYENQCFTIDGDNLIIYFQQYEIAPYSSGIIEFKIPLNKFNMK